VIAFELSYEKVITTTTNTISQLWQLQPLQFLLLPLLLPVYTSISYFFPDVTADVRKSPPYNNKISGKTKYDYQARESTIYRDTLSVCRTTTGSMLQPVSSIGMSIPQVVVSMCLNTSGCHKTNVMNEFTSITAFCLTRMCWYWTLVMVRAWVKGDYTWISVMHVVCLIADKQHQNTETIL